MNRTKYLIEIKQCIDEGHAEPIKTFYQDLDDDRYYLYIVKRCSQCLVPIGGDEDPDEEDTRRFYAGLEPK